APHRGSPEWCHACRGTGRGTCGMTDAGSEGGMGTAGIRRLLRVTLPVLATVAIVAPLAWMWQASRVPGAYSVMDMGYLDYGGGAIPAPGGGRPAGEHEGPN